MDLLSLAESPARINNDRENKESGSGDEALSRSSAIKNGPPETAGERPLGRRLDVPSGDSVDRGVLLHSHLARVDSVPVQGQCHRREVGRRELCSRGIFSRHDADAGK